MRRDSVIIFTVALIVTAGVIGSAHLYHKHQVQTAEAAQQGPTDPATNTAKPPADVGNYAYVPDSTRTSRIIECHDPEIGTFYTNAAECAGADLENRLSDYQPLRTAPSRSSSANRRQVAQSSGGSKSGSRQTGRAPPSGLPPECRFPVGKALELERPLSKASDPYESMWREDYCRWRCEARRERCPVSSNIYDYDYGRMCRDTAYRQC